MRDQQHQRPSYCVGLGIRLHDVSSDKQGPLELEYPEAFEVFFRLIKHDSHYNIVC